MSLKKWNTIFVIAVPVGAFAIFWLIRLVFGAHVRLVAWVALFAWLIGSQWWQSRTLGVRTQALKDMWGLADQRQLTAEDLHQLAPQYSTVQLKQTAGPRPQFLPRPQVVAQITAALKQKPITKKHHRK